MRVITNCSYIQDTGTHLLNIKTEYRECESRYYTTTLDSVELRTLIRRLKASLECEELRENSTHR